MQRDNTESSDFRSIEVPPSAIGERLDRWLGSVVPEVSRATFKQLISEGHLLVNGKTCKPRLALKGGEEVRWAVPPAVETELIAEDIPLEILFEDSDVIVINKPAGLVVHPAPGHYTGTLVNALLFHCKDLGGIGGELRPGIVHRLDKDTSGIIIVAKNEEAMTSLSAQFKRRSTEKEYIALVRGAVEPPTGTIETMIGRCKQNRKKMSSRVMQGRDAISHYRCEKLFGRKASQMRVKIETGRTHQIRVHMAHIGHPILGDQLYGHGTSFPGVERQMLHAAKLSFHHPRTGERISLEAPLPEDMINLLEVLRDI